MSVNSKKDWVKGYCDTSGKFTHLTRVLSSSLKVCKECGVEKPKNLFYPHPDTRDGKELVCKECDLS